MVRWGVLWWLGRPVDGVVAQLFGGRSNEGHKATLMPRRCYGEANQMQRHSGRCRV